MATTDVTAMNTEIKIAYDALKSQADAALSDLKSFSKIPFTANYTSTYKDITNYHPIDTINSVDSMVNTVNNLAANISAVTYTPPNDIGSFQMEDHKIWSDALANKIETNLSSYLDTMGIPSSSFQNAIFNEAAERELQTLNELYELAEAKTGAKGFTYANSMTTILKLDAQQKYQFDSNQAGRDITKLVTEWARSNYQFAIEKGIAFETFHADFTYKYCTAFVDIYKNLVVSSVERFKADLGKYVEPIKALVEAAKLPLEAGKINADIQKANIDTYLESNKVQVDEATKTYAVNVQTALQNFKVQIEALDSIAKQTSQFIQAASRSVIGIQK